MEYLGYQIIEQIAFTVRSVTPRAEVLSIEYGSGYDDSATVGQGVRMFTATSGVWPDEAHVGLLDAKTWFRYYYEFFQERLNNANEPFIIQWDGKYWLVRLAEPEYSFDRFKATGIYTPQTFNLKAIRKRGVDFLTDGSLYLDNFLPSVPEGLTVETVGGDTLHCEWEASTDTVGFDLDAPGTPEGLTVDGSSGGVLHCEWEEAVDPGDNDGNADEEEIEDGGLIT